METSAAGKSMGSLLIVHRKSTLTLRRSRAVNSASVFLPSVCVKVARSDILLGIEAANLKM
ncbi:hypothetical protein L798_15344 [Zootermopsis nevadensis]|uniref:Uncharacterized protein n=1 Tax=Zootermopsis nevadensis TaxID=136037 RepID=A0A067QMR9_ZOONE|nr:hypothetical protein L798_15344 [Zootermopsis nevadensis]